MGLVTVKREIKAPLEKVWAIAGDFTKSPDPSLPITIEKKGDGSNFGIGCERAIKSGRSTYRERLVAVEPLKSITYEMLSGAPVRYYLGKVEVSAEGDITCIHWSADFMPKFWGTGWIVKRFITKNLMKFVDELTECAI